MDDVIRLIYPYMANTGGLPVDELIQCVEEFQGQGGGIMLATNLPRYMIAFAAISQVMMFNAMREDGAISNG